MKSLDTQTIRPLNTSDAAAFKALRLQGLLDSPTAFGASHAEECDQPLAEVALRLQATDARLVFGAFDADQTLIAVVGFYRESMMKLAHKGNIWGMVVAPAMRGQGVGQRLLAHALAHADALPGLSQVNLYVAADNVAALSLYVGAGFAPFGLEAGAMQVDGVAVDEVLMKRLRLEVASDAHN